MHDSITDSASTDAPSPLFASKNINNFYKEMPKPNCFVITIRWIPTNNFKTNEEYLLLYQSVFLIKYIADFVLVVAGKVWSTCRLLWCLIQFTLGLLWIKLRHCSHFFKKTLVISNDSLCSTFHRNTKYPARIIQIIDTSESYPSTLRTIFTRSR